MYKRYMQIKPEDLDTVKKTSATFDITVREPKIRILPDEYVIEGPDDIFESIDTIVQEFDISLNRKKAMKTIATINCPVPDGDFKLEVIDMVNWATSYILLRQTGQGQVHEMMLKKDEAKQLADIIVKWVD